MRRSPAAVDTPVDKSGTKAGEKRLIRLSPADTGAEGDTQGGQTRSISRLTYRSWNRARALLAKGQIAYWRGEAGLGGGILLRPRQPRRVHGIAHLGLPIFLDLEIPRHPQHRRCPREANESTRPAIVTGCSHGRDGAMMEDGKAPGRRLQGGRVTTAHQPRRQ